MFLSKLLHHIYRGEKEPKKTWATSAIFKSLPKANDLVTLLAMFLSVSNTV
jgi:hypothetical protein